ncbi:FtsX-like permease family protein [Paenibacillus marinisediminis]
MNFRQFATRNVFRNKRTYAAYFLSSAFSVMIFFIYSVIAFHPDMKAGLIQQVAVTAMSSAQWIVYVFSFFFILYSVSAFLKTRQHEFGVLMIQGMSHRQMNRLIFLENMIIGLAAILTGIGAGLIGSKLALMIGSNVMDVRLPFYVAPKAFWLTIGSFFILFMVISFLTRFMVSKRKVIQLLQGTNKPKPEPKASILLSLLAAVLLIGSYVLAATAVPATIGLLMIPVIVMTIIGTYFLFSQLSVFIINMLKRNRSFFWRKTNILTLSDLSYRMKDNARMFFMVCIVSTVAFCALGTLSSFGVYYKQLDYDYPFTFNYVSHSGNKLEAEHLSTLEQELKDKQVAYDKITYEMLDLKLPENDNEITLISNSTYNKLAALFNYPTQELTGNEARLIVHPLYYDKEKKPDRTANFKEQGITIKINGVAEGLVADYRTMHNATIVSDDVYNSLKGSSEANVVTGYKVKKWEDAKGIGTELSKLYDKQMDAYYDSDLKGEAPLYSFSSLPEVASMQRQLYSIMMMSALLVGAVFFIAAGSFLYFRLYSDLEQDKAHYKAIGKIGLKDKELRKIATSQLLLLFFIPIVVAIIHSVFAFTALQSLIELSIVGETIKVLAGFTIAQIIYFLVIRWRYINHLRAAVN